MVFVGVGLRDVSLVVFSRICLWDWSFIVLSLSGDHIVEGSVSLSSVEALRTTSWMSLSLVPCPIDIVGDNVIGGPGFLGLFATSGT